MGEFVEDVDYSKIDKLYEESIKQFKEGSVVKGKIVKIEQNAVLVDINYKSEGWVPIEEFRGEEIKVGDEVEVCIELQEDLEGNVILSRERAHRMKVWEKLMKAYEDGKAIEGKVIDKVRGGFIVDVGIRGFLPLSQVDIIPLKEKDLDNLIGRKILVKVVKLNKSRGSIIFSRKAYLLEEREKRRKELIETIKEGMILKGIIKNITDFGVFIDLGGLDGLLHISDVFWGRPKNLKEIFSIGDEIEVIILRFDRESEKVYLGYKQIKGDPWNKVLEKYPVGKKVKGKVVALADYGAFVELEDGIEGLVHISEMSWSKKVKNPASYVSIGEEVEVVVTDVNLEKRRISLSMKKLQESPWEKLAKKYKVGDRIKGIISNITDYGAFVELEDGIEGLIHISDISWTRKIHPKEVFKEGDEVEAVILEIDPKNQKLNLGVKQLTPDPWENISKKLREGMNVKAKIIRFADYGAFAEITDGIEGLIHISEIPWGEKKIKPEDYFSIGDEVTVKVLKIDKESRKVSLSLKAYLEEIGEL